MINTRLSDRIEHFILRQLRQQNEPFLVLRRKELAQILECAPSQITYVINTRFSPDHRYTVESRRGNGGFIRIALRTAPVPDEEKKISPASGGDNPQESVEDELLRYFSMFVSSGAITMREYLMMREMLRVSMAHCPPEKRETAAREMAGRISRIIKEGK